MKTTAAEKLVLEALKKKSKDARGWSLNTLWTQLWKNGHGPAVYAEDGLEAVVKSLVSKGLATFRSYGAGKPRRINLVLEQAA